jgi:hypothetical protein
VSAQQEDIIAHGEHYYDFFRAQYKNAWDSGKHYGCLCDVGFRGADCSLMECPSNEDPLDVETCEKYDTWYSEGNSESGNVIRTSDWFAADLTYYNPISFYPCSGAPKGEFCSGRGVCDYENGVCQCAEGYTGAACQEISALA